MFPRSCVLTSKDLQGYSKNNLAHEARDLVRRGAGVERLNQDSMMRSRYVAAPRNLRGPRSTHKGDNPETDYISFALLGDVLCRRGKQ